MNKSQPLTRGLSQCWFVVCESVFLQLPSLWVKLTLSLSLFLILIGCEEPKIKDYEKIKSDVISFASEIESKNFNRISNISTSRGLQSILDWSDSLRNVSFIEELASNFENFKTFSIKDRDSVIILSLGKNDEVVGATGGYIYLRKENNNYRIDLYNGGK